MRNHEAGTNIIAKMMMIAIEINSGMATCFDSSSGFVPVIFAHINVTAATGDIVRPAAAAIDTTAPTCVGSMPSRMPAPRKN